MKMNFQLTPKQRLFIETPAFETLYGGAAGGGKSYVQVIDALLFALKYQGSKQLCLRESFPELRRSLILNSMLIYPREIAKYNQSAHIWQFRNGSTIEFGYLASDSDVGQYMSAEYDVIRFDEATHFSEFLYTYMVSRIRGANPFPKQVKSSTNPGSVGHAFFKDRFVDAGCEMRVKEFEGGSRIFIPAKVQENVFLMAEDPDYVRRMKNLPEDIQRALLDGDWDVFSGQYFNEFRRDVHVCEPFQIPAHWRRYRSMDYGLDMLAVYWIAVDEQDNAFVYREVYEPNLIIQDAARRILAASPENEEIFQSFAPKDLWNRRQETGRSVADIFAENGIYLSPTSNRRETGWLEIKQRLKLQPNEFGKMRPKMTFFSTCTNIIRTLPSLQHDKTHPNDVANQPHELTHAPDAIRCFCDGRPLAADSPRERDEDERDWNDEVSDFFGYGG